MARPKTNPEIQMFAKKMFYQDLKPKAILAEIENKFDESISLSTVERWSRAFKESETPEDKLMHSPFELHQLGEYGLPWEAGEYLADMCYEFGRYRPTARIAVWCWRVHLMVPDLTHSQVWRVASIYEGRETILELHGIDTSNSDINGFFTFKPWRSQGRLDNYRDAINKGELEQLTGIHTTSIYASLFSRGQIDQLDYLTEEARKEIEERL